MRVLSVRQPWAWAIVHGGKDVENRPRNIAGSYRGPVAIQVSQRDDNDAFRAFARSWDALIAATDAARKRLEAGDWWRHHGHIIGVVDLIETHDTRDEWREARSLGPGIFERDLCSPWAEPVAAHLVLANPRPLAEPLPWKGALGLRTLPDEVEQQILAQLTEVHHG